MVASEADDVLIRRITADLKAAADPVRAPLQQAYMKSETPFLGVPMPVVRRIAQARARERPPTSNAELSATARALWHDAAFREYRYAASQLVDTVAARRMRSPEMLPLFEEFIVTGDWWDHVDETARGVGDLLARFPAEVRPVVRSWIRSDNRWLRRVSIICQLSRGEDTDTALLTEAIDANTSDPDFFIRKAIGWALRQYGRTDPEWVRKFVADRAGALSGLSIREALKHLG